LDITQLKKTQAALTVAKSQADAANKAKSRFLAFASHDLRQPLSALSLFIHVLKPRIEPENHELLARIEACCSSLSTLLTDLLDISKLESGLVHLSPSRFAADTFLQDLGDMYGAVAANKGLQLRLRLNGHGNLAASTDRSLLTRMVGNLVANALAHTSAGGVLLALRYRQGCYWIEIWDSGVGMNRSQSELTAQEFAQFSTESNMPGSGLGLSMVAKTAALLGLRVARSSLCNSFASTKLAHRIALSTCGISISLNPFQNLAWHSSRHRLTV
jgi:signal transduction histidine kinase